MIGTVTLNVAIDKAYTVEQFNIGEVNRVQSCSNTAGGKGLNVAKVGKLCGEEVCATGFVAGHAGAYIEDLLKEQHVSCDFVHTKGETRSCVNILAADGSSTEFLEPGAPVEESDVEAFTEKFEKLLEEVDVITISGSVPDGVPADYYEKLIRMAQKAQKKVILDTSGTLLEHAVKACPTMIKPNDDEIEALLGVPVTNREDIIAGACKLHEMGIEIVVVSLGSDGALVVNEEGIYHGKPPKINVVNTVGCGDSMTAAFAVGMVRNQSMEEILRYAVAVSAANAMTMKTGSFCKEDMEAIYEQVEVIKMK